MASVSAARFNVLEELLGLEATNFATTEVELPLERLKYLASLLELRLTVQPKRPNKKGTEDRRKSLRGGASSGYQLLKWRSCQPLKPLKPPKPRNPPKALKPLKPLNP